MKIWELNNEQKGRYRRLLILFCIIMGVIFLPAQCTKSFLWIVGSKSSISFWGMYGLGFVVAAVYAGIGYLLWLGSKALAGWIMYDDSDYYD